MRAQRSDKASAIGDRRRGAGRRPRKEARSDGRGRSTTEAGRPGRRDAHAPCRMRGRGLDSFFRRALEDRSAGPDDGEGDWRVVALARLT